MMTLPDIPRLYTALAEVLAVLVYAQAAPPRAAKSVTYAATAGWAAELGVFLQLTGSVPLAWWLPCMVAAIAWLYLYLWGTREMNLLEAGYSCARAFILAELAASVEWQLHCVLWPQQRATAPLSVLLLAAVYTAIYGFLYWFERRHAAPTRLTITAAATLMAVVMAVTAFAVSNLSFISDNGVTMSVMSIFYIRTLVDMAGVLILTVQHEQLREAALHSELTAMDNVLRRQYEQYRQSKENIRLINRRYHELKMQIAAIRAERDQAKQDAALAEMESGIRRYEAENKTGNPVLDTLLTAKTLYCQQHGINLTCVADGTLLHFLTTGEICTIVGTVLDNATESVLTEPDSEKRLIRAAIYAQNGFVMLRFENYCADPVELGPDGLPARSVTLTVTNTGSRAGAEIVQVYAAKSDAQIFRPAQELKAFTKVWLEAGESKTVTLPLDDKAFRYWNTKTDSWEVEGGTYEFRVGASSADIRLTAAVEVNGTSAPNPYAGKALPHYTSGKVQHVPDDEWEILLGRPIPADTVKIDRNMTLGELNHSRSPLCWLVWAVLTMLLNASYKRGKPNLNVMFQYNMPLRALAKMTNGAISMGMVDGIVLEAKGFWVIGLLKVIVEAVKNIILNAQLESRLRNS